MGRGPATSVWRCGGHWVPKEQLGAGNGPDTPSRPDLIQTPPQSGLNKNSNLSLCLKHPPPPAQLCLSKSSHQAGSTEGLVRVPTCPPTARRTPRAVHARESVAEGDRDCGNLPRHLPLTGVHAHGDPRPCSPCPRWPWSSVGAGLGLAWGDSARPRN